MAYIFTSLVVLSDGNNNQNAIHSLKTGNQYENYNEPQQLWIDFLRWLSFWKAISGSQDTLAATLYDNI